MNAECDRTAVWFGAQWKLLSDAQKKHHNQVSNIYVVVHGYKSSVSYETLTVFPLKSFSVITVL